MEKGIKKKELIFALFIIGMMFSTLVLISAVPNGLDSSIKEIWENWKDGTLEAIDAKIMVFVLVAIIIFVILSTTILTEKIGLNLLISIPMAFLLTAFVTPDSVLGIFKSYDAVPLTIATVLPLLLFFALTYLSVSKGSRTLMTLQIFVWGIFFFYIAIGKILIPVIIGLGGITGWESAFNIPEWGSEQASWFWGATLIQAVIAGIMTFSNGKFMNLALRKTAGIDKIKAEKTIEEIKRGMDVLTKVGNKVTNP